jgi:hypothetical protein
VIGVGGSQRARRWIRLALDAADVCATTGRLLARVHEPDVDVFRAQLEACAIACAVCEEECVRYEHDACRLCAEACRRCEWQSRCILRALARNVAA